MPKSHFIIFCIIKIMLMPAEASALTHSHYNSHTLPPLALLETACLDYLGMHPRQIKQWYKRAKWSNALPKLQVGFDQNSQDNVTSVLQDNISVTSAGVTIGPDSNRIDNYFNNKSGFEVKAIWYLDQLVFNQDMLLISREARDHYLIRQKVLQELHGAYFELKSLLVSIEGMGLVPDPMTQIKMEQLAARLDSLTGGRFSELRGMGNKMEDASAGASE